MKKAFYILLLLTVISFSALPLYALDFSGPNTSNYTLLEPIPDTQNQGGGKAPTAVQYLQRIYYFALMSAVILAILMLVIAGAEYTAAGVSPSAKEDAKKRIMYALGGLLLALLSWLILNTINPDILKTDLGISKISGSPAPSGKTGETGGGPQIPYQTLVDQEAYANDPRPACEKIAEYAESVVGELGTSCIAGTTGGTNACAATVNIIVATATGEELGGGLSTTQMLAAAEQNEKFVLVGILEEGSGGLELKPGDIFLAPTNVGENDQGHVGIISNSGTIINNASALALVQEREFSTWTWPTTYVYRSAECVASYNPEEGVNGGPILVPSS
ncbi:MAG TPA: hypothetical protein VJJ24_03265 [Candidatus Paceibacterota bacterium]